MTFLKEGIGESMLPRGVRGLSTQRREGAMDEARIGDPCEPTALATGDCMPAQGLAPSAQAFQTEASLSVFDKDPDSPSRFAAGRLISVF